MTKKLTNKELKKIKLKRLDDIRAEREIEVSPIDKRKTCRLLELDLADREKHLGRMLIDFMLEIKEPLDEYSLNQDMLEGCRDSDKYLDEQEANVLKELEAIDTAELN